VSAGAQEEKERNSECRRSGGKKERQDTTQKNIDGKTSLGPS